MEKKTKIMKIKNIENNVDIKITPCKNNHIPASFSKTAHAQHILVNGMGALVLSNFDRVKYICVTIGTENFYTYDLKVLGGNVYELVA